MERPAAPQNTPPQQDDGSGEKEREDNVRISFYLSLYSIFFACAIVFEDRAKTHNIDQQFGLKTQYKNAKVVIFSHELHNQGKGSFRLILTTKASFFWKIAATA